MIIKIPKIINKNNHIYIFVEQCNDNLFLYKEMNLHYKETFSKYDLGLIKELEEPVKGLDSKIMF